MCEVLCVSDGTGLAVSGGIDESMSASESSLYSESASSSPALTQVIISTIHMSTHVYICNNRA